MKKRILIISDSITRNTGYSTVAKNIISNLLKTDKYEIGQLGLASLPIFLPLDITHYSQVKNHSKCCGRPNLIEYKKQGSPETHYLKLDTSVPDLPDQKLCIKGTNEQVDAYGYHSCYYAIQHFKPDIVIPINDLWGLYNLTHIRNRKNFKFVPYLAIDSECLFPIMPPLDPNSGLPPIDTLNTIGHTDIPVVFTNWARNVINKTVSIVTKGKELNHIQVISHGVDIDIWKPLPNKQELRKKYFPMLGPNDFLVGCFLKDTPVLMADLTEKPIQDIKAGDKIINHLGKEDEVVSPDPKNYKGALSEITVAGLPDTVISTNNHPFYAINNRISLGKTFVEKGLSRVKKKWIKAKNLNKNDWLLEPINQEIIDITYIDTQKYKSENKYNMKMLPDTIVVDNDFMRFIGLFLAEGSFQYATMRGKKYKAALYISLNSKEQELIEFIKNYYKKLFGKEPNVRTIFRNTPEIGHVTIELNSKQLFELMEDLINGHHCQTKSLKSWFLKLPSQKQMALIKGFEEGDGHINGNRITTTTTSKTLAIQIGKMLARNNFTYSINTYNWCHIRNPNHSIKYIINRYTSQKKYQDLLCDGKYIYRRIKKVEKKEYEGQVYNFEVKNKNSYVIQNVSVHNSNSRSQPRKRFDANFMSMRKFIDKYEDSKRPLKWYFHCAMDDKLGWNLRWLADYYRVADRCIFNDKLKPGAGPSYEELNEIINCLDVHGLFSNSEGFALTMLETAAAGIPNIVSNYSAHADWGKGTLLFAKIAEYEHEPKTGFIKGIVDTDDVAKQLKYLYESKKLCEEYSRKGIALGKKLQWCNICKEWEKLLDEIDISKLPEDRYNILDTELQNLHPEFNLKYMPE